MTSLSMRNKIIIFQIVLVISIIYTISVYSLYNITKNKQINTPEKLFSEFTKAQKFSNKEKIKIISCPVFPNLPKEYNDKVFEDYYTKISNLDFNNSTYSIKKDSGYYFDVANVQSNGKNISVKLDYTKINQTSSWFSSDIYCMVYGAL